jgi:transposase
LSLLRYGTQERYHCRPPILCISTISRLTGVKPKRVRDLLKLYRGSVKEQPSLFDRKKLRLRQHHIDYLLSEKTLKNWAHLSIKQRAKMFHRTFPEVKLSPTSLWRLYKKHGIKYKFI